MTQQDWIEGLVRAQARWQLSKMPANTFSGPDRDASFPKRRLTSPSPDDGPTWRCSKKAKGPSQPGDAATGSADPSLASPPPSPPPPQPVEAPPIVEDAHEGLWPELAQLMATS